MGILFIVMAGVTIARNMILWSPGFFVDFLLSPQITNEKISMGMIGFGCFLIAMGFRKQKSTTKS